MTTKNATTTTTKINAKHQRALLDAQKRIGDNRKITPAMLVEADRSTKTIASVAKHPLVCDISDERDRGDGVWIYLHDGWISDILETSTIHEDTWAECIALLKEVYFDRSTMDDQDDDAPEAIAPVEQTIAQEEAIAPVEQNGEGFGEAMTLEQIQAINAKRKEAKHEAIRIPSTIIAQINRIQRAIAIQSVVPSMSSRLDIDEAILLLDQAIQAIQQDDRNEAKDRLHVASQTIAMVVDDLKHDGRNDRGAIYSVEDGRNAIEGLIVLHLS
jgi:hypothetical protein